MTPFAEKMIKMNNEIIIIIKQNGINDLKIDHKK